MEIKRTQKEEQTSLISVKVGEKDYGEAVEKSLRDYRRKANIPGFRPGMVPMGIIKKMYGKGVVAEQSYRTASNAVFEYLQKENIDYLGDVIPAEEQGAFDFDNDTEFEYMFEIGEAPKINLALSAKDKVTYHRIKIDKQMHDNYRSNFLRRYGRLVDVEKVADDEALTVTLDNGELRVEDAYVGLISMNDEERKPFKGKKVGAKMKVDINELYKNPAQRAAALQLKENELAEVKPEFSLEITKIRKFADPELNEEFFKTAFPQGNVTDEAGLDAFVDTEIGKELSRESDYLFTLQLRDFLLKKADLKMPAAFLKRWLYVINEEKFLERGDRKGLRPVPQNVLVELHSEALHQGGQPHRNGRRGARRSEGFRRRTVRAVRNAGRTGRDARKLRQAADSRQQGAVAEDLRETLRNEGGRGCEGQDQGDRKGRFRRRIRKTGQGDIVRSTRFSEK